MNSPTTNNAYKPVRTLTRCLYCGEMLMQEWRRGATRPVTISMDGDSKEHRCAGYEEALQEASLKRSFKDEAQMQKLARQAALMDARDKDNGV